MPSDKLNITVVQASIFWEDKQKNLEQYEQFLIGVKEKLEVVVLPEMFSTGFSMNPEKLAEAMDGATMKWMKQIAQRFKCILTGSIIIEENSNFYNRLIWMLPNGQYHYYDKRHLFAYAKEDEHYTAGNKRLIVSVNGWKLCLMVCYDLRFPVWLRNQDEEYDVLIVVANWPERRSFAWKTLLNARAIENMSYVVGVNRVGDDGNNIYHNGGSVVYNPLGETLWEKHDEAVAHTITLDKNVLTECRTNFPFLKDVDRFIIT